MAYLAKITANVQKRMKLASFEANLLSDENKHHTDKKAQNSDVEWDQLHGENKVVKFKNSIFDIFSNFY